MDNNSNFPNNPITESIQNQPQEKIKQYKLSFQGEGGEYFAIVVLNYILTVITLGLYYPWAKVKKLKYLYSATEFESSRLSFTGTGKEMFKGFIKAVFIFVALYVILLGLIYVKLMVAGVIIFYVGFLLIFPMAIHGTYKYRMARTFWRGIRFGYTGDLGQLFGIMIKGFLLTIVTLGIYGSWFAIDLRKYVVNHIKMGDLSFKYHGKGSEYFVIFIKGYLLSILTLGIYLFWFQRDLIRYYIDNLTLENEHGEKVTFKTQITVSQVVVLAITNILLIVFTLGFGYSWVVIRSLKFLFNNIQIEGNLELNQVSQVTTDYSNATGDDLSDMMDIGVVL